MATYHGFFYTTLETMYIDQNDLSEKFKDYLEDNSKVEVKAYMSLLGSLDDEIKIAIPSIKFNPDFVEIQEINPFLGSMKLNHPDFEPHIQYKSGAVEMNIQDILNVFKTHLLKILEVLLLSKENDLEFNSPWLITKKLQRSEKLKKLRTE